MSAFIDLATSTAHFESDPGDPFTFRKVHSPAVFGLLRHRHTSLLVLLGTNTTFSEALHGQHLVHLGPSAERVTRRFNLPI